MSQYTQQQLQQALQRCAGEPIHQIGFIQPHGAMIVIGTDSNRRVLQASVNLQKILGLPAVSILDRPLDAVIGNMQAIEIERLIIMTAQRHVASALMLIPSLGSAALVQVRVFPSDDVFVIELTPQTQPEERLENHLIDTQRALLLINDEADLLLYLEKTGELMRQITGFDRVMIYRFDPNWDGEVIAEARTQSAESYLGSRFPASDIPAQARQLYARNRFRLVVDVQADPVELTPTLNPLTGKPLDMTLSVLRGFSPVHVEYLRNMGVKASMSISLLQNGRLWGLIACHHMMPRWPPASVQDTAALISQIASARLSAVDAQHRQSLGDDVSSVVGYLLKVINIDTTLEAVLNQMQSQMLDLLDGSGLVVVIDGKCYGLGQVPDQAAIDELLAWLGSQLTSDVFACDHLSELFAPAAAYHNVVCGLLASPVTTDMHNCMVWLRPERFRTVRWAGSPQKIVHADAEGNVLLSPRKSFDAWTEAWRGRSASWTAAECDAAVILARALTVGIAQKTRLEQSQAAQREIEKRYTLALNATNDGIWDWNVQTDKTITNPAFSVMLGFAPGELGDNSNTEWMHLLHPDDLDHVLEFAKDSLGRERRFNTEFRLRCKDGGYKWILSRGTLLERDSQGHPLRAIGTHSDLTNRKKMEIQLRDAKEKAEAANLAKSEFLANMGHELLTPMNVILGMTELACRRVTDPRASDQLQTAMGSARQLLSLINGILDISSIGNESLALENISFNLGWTLEKIKGIVDLVATKKGLCLIIDAPDALVNRLFYGDSVRLGEILLHLVGNAVKFTQQGEVSVRVVLAEDRGTEALVRFEIKDSGIGMTMADQEQLFTLFRQVDGSLTRQYGGTGLGLILAKRLAELMGGSIGLNSEPGVGSTFWFTVVLGVATDRQRLSS